MINRTSDWDDCRPRDSFVVEENGTLFKDVQWLSSSADWMRYFHPIAHPLKAETYLLWSAPSSTLNMVVRHECHRQTCGTWWHSYSATRTRTNSPEIAYNVSGYHVVFSSGLYVSVSDSLETRRCFFFLLCSNKNVQTQQEL